VGGGFAYGLAFGTRLSSGLALEVVWSRNNMDGTGTAPGDEDTPAVSQALFQGLEDQLQATILLGTGYAIGPFDPYFLFGAGVTTLAPDADLPGVSRFAWSAGLGLEASFKGRFGFRAQGRFVPSFVRTADALWQGGTGIEDVRSQMTQWEFMAGLVFRF
jgi:opacity protein-like surface antigen